MQPSPHLHTLNLMPVFPRHALKLMPATYLHELRFMLNTKLLTLKMMPITNLHTLKTMPIPAGCGSCATSPLVKTGAMMMKSQNPFGYTMFLRNFTATGLPQHTKGERAISQNPLERNRFCKKKSPLQDCQKTLRNAKSRI